MKHKMCEVIVRYFVPTIVTIIYSRSLPIDAAPFPTTTLYPQAGRENNSTVNDTNLSFQFEYKIEKKSLEKKHKTVTKLKQKIIFLNNTIWQYRFSQFYWDALYV